jgi:hypothetical protein
MRFKEKARTMKMPEEKSATSRRCNTKKYDKNSMKCER